MALLKTYSISTDITGGAVNTERLHMELVNAGDIVGFDGLIESGDDLEVYGTSFTEANVDATVLAHLIGLSKTTWQPPNISLGDGATSGVSLFRAGAGGIQYAFDGASDDEWSTNICLEENGIAYDGSDLQIEIRYQLSSGGVGGDNVQWEVQYAFMDDGDDSDGAGTTYTDTDDISAKLAGQVYTFTHTTNLTGVSGKKFLQLSIKRDATGAGSDTYTGQVWVVGVKINKV